MKQRINKKILGTLIAFLCCMGGTLCACEKQAQTEFISPQNVADVSEEILENSHESAHESEGLTGMEADGEDEESGRIKDIKTPQEIVVHVCGAVCNPGVYRLEEDCRVMDAVILAGGMTEDADTEWVNLATRICDGDKIRIPTKEETETLNDTGQQEAGISASDIHTTGLREKEESRIDINSADEELLCTLPGIGKTRAESIISYREEHGRFTVIEDIMNVSGIKESSFQKIKEYITVK